MRNSSKWLLVATGFVFVTAFQNCSLHQSAGRKFVESGEAKAAKDNAAQSTTSTSQKPSSGSSCEPYINDASASEAMAEFSTTKMVFDQSNQIPTCLISANEQSVVPSLDVASCSISAENLELLQNAPDQTMVLDPYGPLSQGSLGYSKKLSNGNTQFVFVGSSDSALEAVACQFVFDTEDQYQSQAEEVLNKAARLVHAIHPNLR